MAAAYGMGLEDSARPSGLEAPELAEQPVGREIAGRLYAVQPDSPITFRGVPVAGWGGCWDCPTRPGVIDDEAPPVPLPPAWLALLAGLAGLLAARLLGFRRRARAPGAVPE